MTALREIADEDVEAVVAPWRACGLTRAWNDPYKDISFARSGGESTVLVGVVEGRIAAAAMVGHDGHRGSLYCVAVEPALQGKGFGRLTVRAAEDWLAQRGVWKINLLARTENQAVRGFYEKLGYGVNAVICMGKVLPPRPKAGVASGSDMTPVIRDYLASDLDAVIEIFQRAIREVACKDYDAAQIAAWSLVEREEWAPHRLSRPAWIAEIDHIPAGFTDLEPDGHLDMMFVHPGFQGRGVASALLRRVEDAARAQGLTEIFTEASITARPFFASRGFQLIAEQSVESDGQLLTTFRMGKMLLELPLQPKAGEGV